MGISKKRILISPLNWGLGHATRCIPIINSLLDCNQEVLIAASGRSLKLLKEEFPLLSFIEIPDYNIVYPKSGSMTLALMTQLPRIIKSVNREHRLLKKYISIYRIDAVISDNRYGLWNKGVPCVFITHQLHIKASALINRLTNYVNHFFIRHFDECWVPDFETNESLAGELSHPKIKKLNTFYIGPLSRFEKPANTGITYDLAILLSGPEPQRTLLEEIILRQIKNYTGSVVIIGGKPEEDTKVQIQTNVYLVSHMHAKELQQTLAKSRLIISRAGYSSIMDYIALEKEAILIPTPGQTEQEYLSNHFKNLKVFFTMEQDCFDLQLAVEESKKYSVKNFKGQKKPELNKTVKNWLDRIN